MPRIGDGGVVGVVGFQSDDHPGDGESVVLTAAVLLVLFAAGAAGVKRSREQTDRN